MSKPRFGTILDPDLKPTRDAVHVPVIPVLATKEMLPGTPIFIKKWADGLVAREAATILEAVGVVDPYLDRSVQSGELFYCFVKPETTQKLWHEWRHRGIDTL